MSATVANTEQIREADDRLLGTVLAVQANYYQVQLDISSPANLTTIPPVSSLLCTRRTRLKKIGQQVMVGDRVIIQEPDWAGQRGAISEVLPRHSELDRPPVANANQILLVFALTEPPLEIYQLTRFLIKAESTGLNICLALNKSDLISPTEQQEWQQRLQKWGYKPLFISVINNIGLEELNNKLKDKITVVSGPSGVGKSSLINYLIPNINLRVAAVSGKLQRGRHTTRHVELFQLPTGGLLADTPGFNQPYLDCQPSELCQYFPEIKQKLIENNCQFTDCLHRDEPNCIVGQDWERYDIYLDLLEEAIAFAETLNQQADPDATLKLKNKRGKSQYEPRLEARKYRRPSRKTELQALDEMYHDADF